MVLKFKKIQKNFDDVKKNSVYPNIFIRQGHGKGMDQNKLILV